MEEIEIAQIEGWLPEGLAFVVLSNLEGTFVNKERPSAGSWQLWH